MSTQETFGFKSEMAFYCNLKVVYPLYIQYIGTKISLSVAFCCNLRGIIQTLHIVEQKSVFPSQGEYSSKKREPAPVTTDLSLSLQPLSLSLSLSL